MKTSISRKDSTQQGLNVATSLCFNSSEPSQQLFYNLQQRCWSILKVRLFGFYTTVTLSIGQQEPITTWISSAQVPNSLKSWCYQFIQFQSVPFLTQGTSTQGSNLLASRLLSYYLIKQQFKMSDLPPNLGDIWIGLLQISDMHRGHTLNVSKHSPKQLCFLKKKIKQMLMPSFEP